MTHRAPTVLRWMRVPVLLSSLLLGPCTTPLRADGPGMLLYTSPPPGTDTFRKPYMPFQRIGRTSGILGDSIPLPMIRSDGRPYLFAGAGSATFAVPSSLQSARDIVHTTLGFCVAIDGSGYARAWGPTTPQWMPSAQLIAIEPGASAVAAISTTGELIVWNQYNRITAFPVISNAQSLSVGGGWGAAVLTTGGVQPFGFSAVPPPLLPLTSGVRDVAVSGVPSSTRAVAARSDGGLRSMNSAFQASGDFQSVAVSATKLVALTSTGALHHWTWDSTATDWAAPSLIPGSYDDIVVNATAIYALCSGDSDRDGVDDAIQIMAGDIPDTNGDLVDDRTQPPTVLFDDDANGVADAAECSGIGARHRRVPSVWLFNYPGTVAQIDFASSGRVPAGAEALRSIELLHADQSDGDYGVPPDGLTADYSIWLDPTADGDPIDAVLLRSWEINLDPDGRTHVDLGGTWIGPPGTVFLQMLSYVQPLTKRFALFCASNQQLPPANNDLFAASRFRGRTWYGGWPIADAPAGLVGQARALENFESANLFQNIPYWNMNWSDRLPGDCDGDGQLDRLVTGSNETYFGPDLDTDNNGVVDACERDCNLNGVFDVEEIRAGASDCNQDLVPDSCIEMVVDASISGPVPSASTPTVLEFTGLAPAGSQVNLSVEAVADLGAPTELLIFQFPGQPDATLFATNGHDCPATPDTAQFTLSAAAFNSVVANGQVSATVFASTLVDPLQCPSGFVRVSLSYTIATQDCDADGALDACQHGMTHDCNGNGVPDECDLANRALDLDGNGILDACEFDCNGNGTPDRLELAATPSLDCDGSGFIDTCEMIDCNGNGILDTCETPTGSEDCNSDGIFDVCQSLPDCDSDGVPDTCERDCDGDGVPDDCEIAGGAVDKDQDGVPDRCEYALGDFNLDGIVGAQDIAYLLSVWGAIGLPVGDLSGDGTIGPQDLTILLANWGPTDL